MSRARVSIKCLSMLRLNVTVTVFPLALKGNMPYVVLKVQTTKQILFYSYSRESLEGRSRFGRFPERCRERGPFSVLGPPLIHTSVYQQTRGTTVVSEQPALRWLRARIPRSSQFPSSNLGIRQALRQS